ncbi:DUF3292 domain-containing protein [Melissococcus plutonius]|uniref:DUF3292 domain-containing protein n=1 Tax=Melissococcus plutonius TaxID=33970 RepID=UPI0021E5E9EE|nr:DUF3292 domain-containing protein [Melissococcus plutonius]MCV2505643.1 DUF3292 domain-containing protein [Melissococcus plutonius]
MTDIVKIKQDGVQIYPQSHWKAILGAPESVKGEKGDKGDPGDKGEKGDPGENATTTEVAKETADGLMAKEDKEKLDGLSMITLEKVGTIE